VIIAPIPDFEDARINALQQLKILDTETEEGLDAIVNATASILGVPISAISLMDTDRQWLKASVGLCGQKELPRDGSFCSHAMLQGGLFEVPNALEDERFHDNPLVTGEPHIRFYAGAPLLVSGGANVGMLCVIDRQPRTLNAQQKQILSQLAKAASQLIEMRSIARNTERSASQFQALSQASPLGIFATDLQGACTYTNDAWQKIFGMTAAQSMLTGWTSSLNPQDASTVSAQWLAFTQSNQPFDMTFRINPQGGDLRVVHSRAAKIVNACGQHTGYVGTIEDVTDQTHTKHANQSLLNMIEKHFIVSMVDLSGHITDMNDAFCDFNGYSQAELRGQDHRMLNASPQSKTLFSRMWAKLETGESWQGEICHRKKDGVLSWVDSVVAPLRGADGAVEQYVSVSRDISKRKHSEEQLRKSKIFLDRTGSMAGVGGWEVDLLAKTLYWSDETCRIQGEEPGYAPTLEEAIAFYAPDSRSIISAAIDKAISTGEGWDLELELMRKDGVSVWVRAIGSAEFENEQAVRLLGAFQNITETIKTRRLIANIHHRMLQLATTAGGVGIWEYDVQKRILLWDELVYRLYGQTPVNALTANNLWTRHIHPNDRKMAEASFEKAIAKGTKYETEFRIIWADDSVHTIKALGHVERDTAGTVLRVVGVNWDVSHEREIEAALVQQNELLRITMQSIGDSVITTNAQGNVTWLNPTAERMTGWTTLEAQGRPLDEICHIVNQQTRLPAENLVQTCIEQGKNITASNHSLLVSRDAVEFGIENSAAPIRDSKGVVLGAVLVLRDVTEKRRLADEMHYRATHDDLTGLVNRAEFESRLCLILEKSHKDGSVHTLLYIDLDEFKLVNDACGHMVGDLLLQQVSRLMGDVIRADDTLARLGGDEFGVLLSDCNSEQAQQVAQQICDRMEEFRFLHEDKRFRVTSSIGLVEVSDIFINTSAVMQAADTCCYAAKEGGRNRVHTWIDNDQAIGERRRDMQWTSRIEHALDENRFVLYAQRLQPLEAGTQGIHAEVLLRMLDSDGSIISPAAFLPAAERFHLASRIDRWVLRHAIAWLDALGADNSIELLCINLSGQSVGDRAFHRYVLEHLATIPTGLCKRLCFEITETAAVTNLVDAAHFVEQLRALGIRVALDDFGAGASSFGYLKRLRVDYLKIDGQFIKDLLDDPLDDVAVRCFVDVAKVMGIKTVAEYVDNAPVLGRIKALGVNYSQGFFFHKPEPIERLLASTAFNNDEQIASDNSVSCLIND
jgi:diguanylate cyclase (GGDEF)-like protein/PAS domain S-box-containing protein